MIVVISCSNDKTVKITSIANCGFLVESNNKQILIDALFDKGYNQYLVAHDSISSNIINGVAPFDKSNLLLITHTDGDHFNDSLVIAYLSKDSKNLLFGPSSVIRSVLINPNGQRLKSQTVEIDSLHGYQLDTTVYGIRIKSYFMQHGQRVNFENVGYVIDIGGVIVFHSGDYTVAETEKFETLQLYDEKIDLALLNFYGFWVNEKEREFTKRTVNPKNIVLMHLPIEKVDFVIDSVAKIEDFIDVTIFRNSMESKVFYYKDKK